MPEWITVNQAAEILNVKPDRVRKLCRTYLIVAEKFGDVWMVNRKSVMAYKKTYRKPGPKPGVKIKVAKASKQALKAERGKGDDDGDDVPF